MTKLPPTSIELSVDRVDNDIRISARGPHGEQTKARALGVDRKTLLGFWCTRQNSKQSRGKRFVMRARHSDFGVTGDVEWLEPIEGRAAKMPGILERLRWSGRPLAAHRQRRRKVDNPRSLER